MKNDALSTNTSRIGKELMAEAEARLFDRMRSEVRMEFDYVLVRLELHSKELERVQEWLEFFAAKRKALEHGKFTITPSGQLVMNDPELQREMQNPNNHESKVRR